MKNMYSLNTIIFSVNYGEVRMIDALYFRDFILLFN